MHLINTLIAEASVVALAADASVAATWWVGASPVCTLVIQRWRTFIEVCRKCMFVLFFISLNTSDYFKKRLVLCFCVRSQDFVHLKFSDFSFSVLFSMRLPFLQTDLNLELQGSPAQPPDDVKRTHLSLSVLGSFPVNRMMVFGDPSTHWNHRRHTKQNDLGTRAQLQVYCGIVLTVKPIQRSRSW